jgi:hypothetical protein
LKKLTHWGCIAGEKGKINLVEIGLGALGFQFVLFRMEKSSQRLQHFPIIQTIFLPVCFQILPKSKVEFSPLSPRLLIFRKIPILMKIEFLESERIIKIEDGLKKQYLLLKFVLLINMFNATIFLLRPADDRGTFLTYLWFVLILVSVYVLYMLFFKKSTNSELPVDEIKDLKVGKAFNSATYRFRLKNGKERNLMTGKSEANRQQILDLADQLGIPLV